MSHCQPKQCLLRVPTRLCLAQDVQSDIDMPPPLTVRQWMVVLLYRRYISCPVELTVIEDIAARSPAHEKGAARTGVQDYDWRCRARRADAVVKFEETEDPLRQIIG